MKNDDFKDFVFLSHIVNQDSTFQLNRFVEDLECDYENWKFVTGSDESFYDITFKNGKNLLKDNPEPGVGGKTYYKFMLLIDKERHIRGMYLADRYDDIDRLAKK